MKYRTIVADSPWPYDGWGYGARLEVRNGRGEPLLRRAISGVMMGEDFPVVWACREEEWERALTDGRPPEGVPWPAEDVSLLEPLDQCDPDAGKDPAAVALGRKGGLKGGKARAQRLTPEERSEAARKAARARWRWSA